VNSRRWQGFLIVFLAATALSAMAQESAPTPAPEASPADAASRNDALRARINFPAVTALSAMAQESAPAPQESPADAELRNDALRARISTLYGPAGLIIVPHSYVTTQRRTLVGTYIARDVSASANYGLLRGVDVGAAYVNPDDGDGEVLANAKVNIVPSNFGRFQLGLGVIDLLDMLDQTFYIMASAEWGMSEAARAKGRVLRLHLGYGTGLFDDSLIGGGEYLLTRRLAVIGEYDGDRVNAALRYIRDEGFRMQIGLASSRLFFSTAYAFAP
jgi:hypothetical protein